MWTDMALNPTKVRLSLAVLAVSIFIAFVSYTVRSDFHRDRWQYEQETESVSRGLFVACLQTHGTDRDTVERDSYQACRSQSAQRARDGCKGTNDLFGSCEEHLYDIEFSICQRVAFRACSNAGDLWTEPQAFPLVLRYPILHFTLGEGSRRQWIALAVLISSLLAIYWGLPSLRRVARWYQE